MKAVKWILGLLFIAVVVILSWVVLSSEKALVLHPKGIMARSELKVITTQLLYMLIIIVPTFCALFFVAWRYRAHRHESVKDVKSGPLRQSLMWILPSIIVAFMTVVLWDSTHALDPYKPLEGDKEPLEIQVIALDWKWLFVYPEQGVASVNLVAFPEKRPVHFSLAADKSPMNSFWIPQLSGQIYSMTGMITPLYIMADEVGEFTGRAAEINGDGFAGMTFTAKSLTDNDFDKWVEELKQAPQKLTHENYQNLIKPTSYHPVELYSFVENNLFDDVVMKYMHPPNHDHNHNHNHSHTHNDIDKDSDSCCGNHNHHS